MKIVHFIPPPSAPKRVGRGAVEKAAQRFVEQLETRRLLSVALNSAGFTVVTPSPDSRLIYVSASGSDTLNTGLSPSSPFASIGKAYGMMRNGYPDWILLERGDTLTDSFSGFAVSGRSQQEPTVVTDYGDPSLPRPIVDAGANVAFRMSAFNQFVDVIGISFTSSTHDPTSPNFTGQGNMGFYDLGGTSNLLIEDCSFSYFIFDITLQGFYAPLYNITVRRDQILDAYSSTTSAHAEGLYADTCNGLYIEDNTFDHDGWNASVPGGQATIFNQDCYLHSSNNGVVVTDNVFADAGSFGLQARSGGIVDDNIFINNPYGFSFGLVNGATTRAGGVSGEAIGNVVIGTRVDPSGSGIGAMIGNLAPGGGTVISNNIFADGGGNQAAIMFQPGDNVSNPQQEVGLNTVTISNNIVYNWGFSFSISNQFVPGSTGADGLTGVVVRNNDFQDNVTGRLVSHGDLYDPRFEDWSGNVYSSTTAPVSQWFSMQGTVVSLATWQADVEPTAVNAVVPFVNPGVSVASYMVSQGMPATLAAFITGARSQSATNWNPLYLASTIANYIQGGFIVDGSPPIAVVTPPPDITPSNYQTTPNPTFTVTYNDNVAVNPATISGASLTVIGAGGLTIPVTLLGTTGAGASIVATYQLSAPNNDWTTVPNETFVIALAGGQIKDTAGNVTPAQPLGSFQVTVNADPNAPTVAATTPDYLNAVASSSSISLSWADSAGDERSYLLQRAVDPNFTQQVQSFPLTGDALSYVDTSVAVGTTYYYQLIAINPIGASLPTAAASAVVLPPAPIYSGAFLNDNNAQRTAVMSATLKFTQPVTVNASLVSLIQNPTTTATPITITVSNPTSDGKTWIVSWATGQYNNALPDGSYSLTVHGGMIADAFGQAAGGDKTTNFTSADAPVVTAAVYGHVAPPHTLSFTFSEDVSASLSLSALKVLNSSSVAVPAASYSWNPATLTVTYTFAGALADGSYTARLSSAIIANADGVKLDGAAMGIPGNDYVYSFTQVKPTLSLSGAAFVNAAVPYNLTLGAITDAGEVNPSYVVHWGDGTTTAYAAAGKVAHTYASAIGPAKITVDVIDANGTHAGAASLSVTVEKATIVLSGAANANPLAVYSLTLGAVSDAGFTVSQYIVHWGDGSSMTYTANGLVQHTYPAESSAKSTAITVDLVDNSGTGGASFTNLAVTSLPVTLNSYPYVPINSGVNANAGGIYRLLLGTPVDNGFTIQNYTINWGDGTPVVTAPAGTTLVTHPFASNVKLGSDTIVVGIVDNSGTYNGADSQIITINPAPTVALTGSTSANVGGVYALGLAAAVDIGQTVTAYTINWGDGSSTPAVVPGNYVHTYGAAGAANITVDLTDGTGTFPAAGSLAIQVNNSPTVALSGNPYANAGGVYTLNFGAVNDPGQTVSQYTVNWGDGTNNTFTTMALTFAAATHVYAKGAQANITVDLVDGTGAYTGAGSMLVDVTQPGVNLEGSPSAFVGQSYSLTIDPASDLGGTPQDYVVHWGDGSAGTYMTPGTVTHTYAVTQKTVITADLVDTTGSFSSIGTMPLIVVQPPTVKLTGAGAINVGAAYTLNVGVPTDQISAVTSMTVHWGDNSSSVITGAKAVTHVYAAAGPAVISVDITDQNETYPAAAMLALTVNQPTVALAGNATVNQGQPYALTLGNPFDPGQTVTGYTIHWGDGSSTPSSTTGVVSHTYGASGSDTITVDMTDGIGSYPAVASLPVQVIPAPVVTLSGNADANAGGVYTLNLANVVDSNGAPTQYTVHWGDGTMSTNVPAGPYYHQYNLLGPQNITIDATDPAGTFTNVGALSVIVNPSPTVSLAGSGVNANVGGTYTLNLGAISDPGYAVSQYFVNWGDGQSTTIPIAGPTAPGASGSGYGPVTHPYGSVGPQAIIVSLTDATGNYTAATLSVNVNQPTVALAGNPTANQGQPYSLTLGNVFDPGQTVTGYAVHWGDGLFDTYASGGVVYHTYGSTGSDIITVDMSDTVGSYPAVATLAVQVNSPTPVVMLSGNAYANAGGLYTLNVANVVDPNGAPTQYTVHWGDGMTSTSGSAAPFSYQYSSPGPESITIDATDPAGTFANVGGLSVTVSPAPTVALTGSNVNANIGTIYTLNLGAISDPGYTVSQYAVSWGDGQTTTIPIASPTAPGASGSGYGPIAHKYTATGAETVGVTLTDGTGVYTAATLPLTVNQPTLSLSGNTTAVKGQSYALTIGAPFDPGQTITGYTIHWGDGSTSSPTAAGVDSHTYAAIGSEKITVDMTDGVGAYAAIATKTIQVTAVPPVITLSGVADANVGGSYKLSIAKVVDPNGTPTKYTIHWGDGASSAVGATGPYYHNYTATGARSIMIDATDAAGTFANVGTLSLVVNPAPTVALTGSNTNANVTGTYTLNLGAITDPGYTVSKYKINWGDGNSSSISISSSTAPGASGSGYGPITHKYTSTGSRTISVLLTDSTGTYTAATLAIVVNHTPTLAITGNSTANAAAPYSLNVAAAVDIGYTVSLYTIHWGDGKTSTTKTPGALTHTYATAGSYTISADITDPTGTYVKVTTLAVTVHAVVAGQFTFYNDSTFNAYKTTASTSDFAAIAPDKQALLPGHTATFANITSYTNGLNGIIVDVAGLPAGTSLSAKDFTLKAGNTSKPSSWATAPAPTSVTVFRGDGVNGSDRIVINFANKAIFGKWLQVSVLPTASTGLAAASVFYFGNAPGYSGANPSSAQVTAADVSATKARQSSSGVPITNNYDFNRDGLVSSTDASAALADETTTSTMLQLISV